MKLIKKDPFSKLKNNEFIKCNTRDEAKALLMMAHEAGYKWINGESFLNILYGDNLNCYAIKRGTYASEDYVINKGFRIVPVSNFL